MLRERSGAPVQGGRFVVETHVPELQRLLPGQTILPFRADPGGLSFDVYDVVTQRFSSQHYRLRRRVRPSAVEFRYAWPAELDLMARIAGLALRDASAVGRASRSPGSAASHVSVYAKR